MASLSTLLLAKITSHARNTTLGPRAVYGVLHRTQSTNQEPENELAYDGDETASDSEYSSRLAELRDVSRLTSNQYKQYHGQPPELPYKDLKKQKMLYAKYGSASGEDPRILWPSREKLLDLEAEEKEEGGPLLERIAQIQAEKQAQEKAKLARQAQIQKNMSQMAKWIKEYKKKQETLDKQAQERAAKREALLEEARDYFGYKIQPNDPKFQQMVEEKEEKERKEAKKRKKEEKMKKVTERLKQQDVPTSSS